MPERTVLKENQIYLVSDDSGDIASHNTDGHGLYWRDTRFLSLYELTLNGTRPTLLSSAGEHSFMNTFQFANAPLATSDNVQVGARTISVRRNRFIQDGLHERIGLYNYNSFAVVLQVAVAIGSDFRDMFDVRGYTTRAVHGNIAQPSVEGGTLQLKYLGLDGLRRTTQVYFDPAPTAVKLAPAEATDQPRARLLPGISGQGDPRTEYAIVPPSAQVIFEVRLEPKQSHSITVRITPTSESSPPSDLGAGLSLDAKFLLIRDSYRQWESESTEIKTDHEILNAVISRASQDLRLLSDRVPEGYVPSAGIPWFSVPFGRDSLITSMQTMMLQPDIAYGSLSFLAAHQGQKVDDWRDEEPGKILHEVRMGEFASLGQVPHTPITEVWSLLPSFFSRLASS